MRLKSLLNNITLSLVAVVAIGLVTGVHVRTQAPFLVFGSNNGSSQVIKSTGNALWVSLQGGATIPTASCYGFVGVSNCFGLNGTSTAIKASDGGAYLNVNAGSVFINSATLTFGSGGTADTTITRPAANELTYSAVLFSALGTPANGTMGFCSDCQPTTPATCPATKASCVCAGSGTGALAVRLNGVWDCGTFQ